MTESPALAKRFILTLCLLLATLLGCGEPTISGRTRQALLVIQFGDDRHLVQCVSFAEDSISGFDLLMRSGLEIHTWGKAVCRIEIEGCSYPAERCFCQCQGSPCAYWSYWKWEDNRWVYSQVGSADHMVKDGDAEGWVWGDGQSPPNLVPAAETCPTDATGQSAPTADNATSLGTAQAPGALAHYAALGVMASLAVVALPVLRTHSRE